MKPEYFDLSAWNKWHSSYLHYTIFREKYRQKNRKSNITTELCASCLEDNYRVGQGIPVTSFLKMYLFIEIKVYSEILLLLFSIDKKFFAHPTNNTCYRTQKLHSFTFYLQGLYSIDFQICSL